ncbi:MAG: hypothetical protein ABSF14_24735 [Terriglobia bacterium]
MDSFKSIAVPTNFLLVPVVQIGLAKHDRGDPRLISHDALNPVRRHRAFNQGMFAQDLQFLGGLPGKELLLPAGLAKVSQVHELAVGIASMPARNCRSVIISSDRLWSTNGSAQILV